MIKKTELETVAIYPLFNVSTENIQSKKKIFEEDDFIIQCNAILSISIFKALWFLATEVKNQSVVSTVHNFEMKHIC